MKVLKFSAVLLVIFSVCYFYCDFQEVMEIDRKINENKQKIHSLEAILNGNYMEVVSRKTKELTIYILDDENIKSSSLVSGQIKLEIYNNQTKKSRFYTLHFPQYGECSWDGKMFQSARQKCQINIKKIIYLDDILDE